MLRRFLVPAAAVIVVTGVAVSLAWVVGFAAATSPHISTLAYRVGPGDSAALFGPQLEQSIADQVRGTQDALEAQARADQEAAAAAEAVRQSAANRGTQNAAPAPSGLCAASDFVCFRACTIQRESRGDYSINTGNGYYGAWQFAQGTWDGAVTRAGYPEWAGRSASDAPPAVQDAAAAQLYSERGSQPWAPC